MTIRPFRLLDSLIAPAFAVPLIFSLLLWQSNVKRLPYEDALPTIAVLMALAFALMALIRLRTGNWSSASVITAVWTAYLLYAPTVADWLFDTGWLSWLAMLGLAVLAWDAARRVATEKAALGKVGRYANILLLPYALTLSAFTLVEEIRLENGRPDPPGEFTSFNGQASQSSPDVWHIVMDRYASRSTLDRVYGYDNGPFLEALRQRGFVVRDDARSNYQRTAHSVSSTLNGAYLDGLARDVGEPDDWVPLYRAMTNNAAVRFFRHAGYETIFAGSWWNPTRRSPLADRNVNFRAMPELARLIWDKSLFGRIASALELPYGDSRADQCARLNKKFAALRDIAAQPNRKYVFAHFLVPHPPFVIDGRGNCRTLAAVRKSTREENYRQQLVFANRELIRLVDAIRAGPRPATIVIHADEGPWPHPFVGDEDHIGRDPVSVDWARLDHDQLREKMGILMAVRYADGQSREAPETPVNVYREVLAHGFSAPRRPQPDRSYVFLSDLELYRFKEVTAELRSASSPHR